MRARKMVAAVALGAIGLLAVLPPASAIPPLPVPDLRSEPGRGPAGSEVRLHGDRFSNDPAAGPIEIRWNTTEGPPLLTSHPLIGFAFWVRVPETARASSEPYSFTAIQRDPSGIVLSRSTPFVVTADFPSRGYRLVASDGGVFAYGDAGFFGSIGGSPLNRPIVGMEATPSGNGYWLVASDGGVFAFGDAGFFGSMAGLPLSAPIVGLVRSRSGRGYLLGGADGRIYPFGDAGYTFIDFQPPLPPLSGPVVAIETRPPVVGHWLATSDGQVHAIHGAGFHGSAAGAALAGPVVGMSAHPSAQGYWLVASDGGVFAFGDSAFRGSVAGTPLVSPMVGVETSPTGAGYWTAAADGGVFAFGDAPFLGSAGGIPLVRPVVGLTATRG